MTSELKPCPFCGEEPTVIDCDDTVSFYVECENSECGIKPLSDTANTRNEALEIWNTRATPSADTLAGLVRFKSGTDNLGAKMVHSSVGEYVLYSEAAAVVAAFSDRLKGTEEALDSTIDEKIKLELRVEATETKLAQIKAQEPVATVELRALNGRRVKHIYPINLGMVEAGSALYAAPVSDSLRVEAAKLAKYCEWYESVDELGAFPDIQDVMVPLGDLRALRAALNAEASNDKE